MRKLLIAILAITFIFSVAPLASANGVSGAGHPTSYQPVDSGTDTAENLWDWIDRVILQGARPQ